MTKAWSVQNLHCEADVAREGAKILRVRLDETVANHGNIEGESDSAALHNLRISAKRLRYSLETFAFCFPYADAKALADEVKALQDLLGRIHDLDVLVEILLQRVTGLDTGARDRAIDLVHRDMSVEEREAALLQQVDNDEDRGRRLGLYHVIAAKLSERGQKYIEFERLWRTWEEDGFLRRVEAVIEPVTQ